MLRNLWGIHKKKKMLSAKKRRAVGVCVGAGVGDAEGAAEGVTLGDGVGDTDGVGALDTHRVAPLPAGRCEFASPPEAGAN